MAEDQSTNAAAELPEEQFCTEEELIDQWNESLFLQPSEDVSDGYAFEASGADPNEQDYGSADQRF